MGDFYRRIASPQRREIKVKGSRFIAEAYHIDDEAAAQDCLAEVRRREYGATHHCWAYRLGVEGDVFRYSDDGEPNGTAGRPIHRQIEARDLTNVLVIVTRYFGGTKLGTGGLARAYGDAAAEVLEACEIVKETVRIPVRIRFAYEDTSPAMHAIDQFDAIIQDSRYSEETELVVALRASQADAFQECLVQNLAGRVQILTGEK